eukprot:33026-Rhodomonas_salina.4
MPLGVGRFMGRSNSRMGCGVLQVNGNRIAVSDGIGGWSIEADFAANALYYTYVTGAVNCSGHLNVSGGVFLGIPRSFVPGISITDNIEDENKTAWDVSYHIFFD